MQVLKVTLKCIGWLLKNHCNHTKPNLTMEECRAMKQLREDQSKVILTVDKGVAMVIITSRTIQTRHFLFYQVPVHTWSLTKTPPTNSKRNSYRHSRISNKQEDSVPKGTGKCTQQGLSLSSFMASPKYTKLAPLQAHSVHWGFHYIWDGKRTGIHH